MASRSHTCVMTSRALSPQPLPPCMAHQDDQRNVPNAKMHVVAAKNPFFFPGSKVVKISQNWPAEFRHRRFVIGGAGGRGGASEPPPPPTKSILAGLFTPSRPRMLLCRTQTVGHYGTCGMTL